MMRRREMLMLGAALAAGCPHLALAQPAKLSLDQLYDPPDLAATNFAAPIRALAGRQVVVDGFVAPHASGNAPFHIVTARPVATCPHCGGQAMPADALLAYIPLREQVLPVGRRTLVSGRLELGAARDVTTGFLSTARLRDAQLILF
jgi:hypothetical protein